MPYPERQDFSVWCAGPVCDVDVVVVAPLAVNVGAHTTASRLSGVRGEVRAKHAEAISVDTRIRTRITQPGLSDAHYSSLSVFTEVTSASAYLIDFVSP